MTRSSRVPVSGTPERRSTRLAERALTQGTGGGPTPGPTPGSSSTSQQQTTSASTTSASTGPPITTQQAGPGPVHFYPHSKEWYTRGSLENPQYSPFPVPVLAKFTSTSSPFKITPEMGGRAEYIDHVPVVKRRDDALPPRLVSPHRPAPIFKGEAHGDDGILRSSTLFRNQDSREYTLRMGEPPEEVSVTKNLKLGQGVVLHPRSVPILDHQRPNLDQDHAWLMKQAADPGWMRKNYGPFESDKK